MQENIQNILPNLFAFCVEEENIPKADTNNSEHLNVDAVSYNL